MSNSRSKKAELSPGGEARRGEMLECLQLEMKTLQRRRSQGRGVLILGCCLVAVFSISFWQDSSDPNGADIAQNRIPVAEAVSSGTPSWRRVQLVQNRDDVLSKYLVSRSEPIKIFLEILDDAQLAQQLTEVGRPSVVGRIDGEFRVIALD